MDVISSVLDLSSLGIEGGTLLMFGLLLVLLLTGMPLALVTLLVALLFALGWFGPMAVPLITSRVYSFVSSFVFVSVPMFVLMAAILDRSGIARDLFDAMKLVAGRVKGGVAVQTIFVAVILAAMSGIIGGEIVLLGLVALPQMLRQGYDRRLAIGVVCAGGSLGTMVPPSIVLIIYGLTANVSVGELFTAAFVPGFMLAAMYVAYVVFRSYTDPTAAPPPETRKMPAAEQLKLLRGLILPGLVVVFVLGSIYGGIASVTEASAVGVAGVILSTLLRREFSFAMLLDAALHTLTTVGMIVWIGIGASALVGVYNLMGGIDFISSLIAGVSDNTTVIVLTMMLILFVLGMFLDWVGIALLTMPIFVPVIRDLGLDPIWFGVLFAMNMQVSFL
ncbi:MAG TPA: C4-dicarboxylate ABC transporter permease, partial [Citreicella sp.]|nr:C4-dicarboxylate ABC transporter permease [Citreicella sp.]